MALTCNAKEVTHKLNFSVSVLHFAVLVLLQQLD